MSTIRIRRVATTPDIIEACGDTGTVTSVETHDICNVREAEDGKVYAKDVAGGVLDNRRFQRLV